MPPPAMPNIGALLGQLASSPPVGPIPTTPYAPANVAPLQLQQPIAAPPPYIQAPPTPPRPQFTPSPISPLTAQDPLVGGLSGTGGPYGGAPRNSGWVPMGHPAQTPFQASIAQRFGITPHPAAQPPAALPSSLLHLMGNPGQSNLGQALLHLGAPPNMQQRILQSLARPEVYHGGAG